MFAKLMKYDTRMVFKNWWIAAASSLGLALFGGLCVNILNVDYTKFVTLQVLAGFGLFLAVVGIIIFAAFGKILVLMRFYKNFFTDEGYLTFTLPVRNSQLLNSKLLTAFIFDAATVAVVIADVFIILALGVPEAVFDPTFWKRVISFIGELFGYWGVYTPIYLAEGLALLLLFGIMGVLMFYICITVSAVMTRKYKVLVAIAIYYLASGLFSSVLQVVFLNSGFLKLIDMISELSQSQGMAVIAVMLLGLAAAAAAICVGLYMVENLLLDRKLNLE